MTPVMSLLLFAACGGDEKPAPKPDPKPTVEAPKPPPAPVEKPFADLSDDEKHAKLMEVGKEVYLNSTLACQTCHGAEGKGQEGVYPPLVGQKEHMGDCLKHAAIVIYGMNGPLTVDGVEYNGVMTPQGALLDDMQIAAVISYERMSWGNDYGYCMPEVVAEARTNNPLAK